MYWAHIRHAGHVGVVKGRVKEYGQPDDEDGTDNENSAAHHRVSRRVHISHGHLSQVEPFFGDLAQQPRD